MTSEIAAVIADLRQAHSNLEAYALKETNQYVRALRRAQSRLYRRTAEYLAANPMPQGLVMTERLKWYTENWAALERTVARDVAKYYRGYTASYQAGYNRMAEMAENLMAGNRSISQQLAAIPKEWIEHARAADLKGFNMIGQRGVETLRQTFYSSAISGTTPAGMLASLKGAITGEYAWGNKTGLYEWHAGTYARKTQMENMQNWMHGQGEKLGLDYRLYSGPVDGKTRSFCLDHVGGAYSIEDIEQMDNSSSASVVLVDRGGWGCRHQWVPIDKELAMDIKKDMAGEGKVAEEFKKPVPKPKTKP